MFTVALKVRINSDKQPCQLASFNLVREMKNRLGKQYINQETPYYTPTGKAFGVLEHLTQYL